MLLSLTNTLYKNTCLHITQFNILTVLFFTLIVTPQQSLALLHDQKIVGANSGGEGPFANTLPGITLASQLDLDFIEIPVVASKDNKLLIYNSLNLDPATDVTDLFPEKARKDGTYNPVDFTIQEIRQLRQLPQELSPTPLPSLAIPILDEALPVVQVLEEQVGKDIGIIIRLINPAKHNENEKDLSMLVLQTLEHYDYTTSKSQIMIESEDGDELQRLKKVLLPQMEITIPLMQRIDVNGTSSSYDLNWMLTRLGLRVISSYADVLALHTSYITGMSPQPMPETFLDDARALGLSIYTFPIEEPTLSPFQPSVTEKQPIDSYLENSSIDGLITDAPNIVLLYKKKKQLRMELELRAAALNQNGGLPEGTKKLPVKQN